MRTQARENGDTLQTERDDHATKIQQANQRLAKAMSLIKDEKQTATEKSELAAEVALMHQPIPPRSTTISMAIFICVWAVDIRFHSNQLRIFFFCCFK